VNRKAQYASFATVGLLCLAAVVGAQGPRGRGGFGPDGFGGPGGGGRAAAKCAPNCTAYQFTFTRTSVQPVLLAGKPDEVKSTTTGTLAGDIYGSTYREVKLSPWGSSSNPREFIYVRDLDPKVMMNYVVNVTKGTYEQFAIVARTPRNDGKPRPTWMDGGPHGPGAPGKAPTSTTGSYALPDGSYSCPDAVTTTFTHGPNSTTNRVYCPELRLVLEEDKTDPRFGTTNYVLSKTTVPPVFPFAPTGTLVDRPKFGHDGGPGGKGRKQMPPPQD
jgi:hypothetical protein